VPWSVSCCEWSCVAVTFGTERRWVVLLLGGRVGLVGALGWWARWVGGRVGLVGALGWWARWVGGRVGAVVLSK
jgi:hypothetical protein